MDDNIRRNISIETLEKVKQKINPMLLKDLPFKPEEILPYVTRRTDPVISPNIDKKLAESMKTHRLSDEEYLETLFMALVDTFSNKKPVENPKAYTLLSQTGAGKTNLRTAVLQENPNIVVINSDLYKQFRPDAKKILQEDATHFGALTGIDSYDHARNITDFATAKGYNILIECAPSLTQGLIGVDIEGLKKAGYNTEFDVMAVGNLISALAIHMRYEHEIAINRNNGNTKLTDLKRHNESYLAVEKAIRELQDSIEIFIYRRGTEEEGRIPVKISKKGDKSIDVLNNERDRSNKQYIESGKFREDYKVTECTMEHRQAPKAQIEQLGEIYKMYKQQVEQEVDFDD